MADLSRSAEKMMTLTLARLLVRLHGAVFLFYAVVDLTYLPNYYRSYVTIHEVRSLDEYATQNFAMAVLRVGLHALAALVLLARSDKVIAFFTGDRNVEANSFRSEVRPNGSADDRR
jgi:hypothetical protein